MQCHPAIHCAEQSNNDGYIPDELLCNSTVHLTNIGTGHKMILLNLSS